VAVVRVAVVLGGDCPKWQMSVRQLSWVAVVQVAVVRMTFAIEMSQCISRIIAIVATQ